MRQKRIRDRRTAFTLIEAIVVIIIIGVLATIIAPRLFSRVGQSKRAAAGANAVAIAQAIKLYQADYGSLPESGNLALLVAKPSGPGQHGPYLDNAEQLLDPWGKPFFLTVPGKKNFDFDVVSYGADARPGGSDEDEDIVKP